MSKITVLSDRNHAVHHLIRPDLGVANPQLSKAGGQHMEGHQQQKILVVDNDERVLRVMDGFLANAGFDTRTASDGHIAVDLLQSQECDLVLVADHLADFSLDDFLKELQRLATRPSVIVMESDPLRPWSAGPYSSLGASKAVNKWRPCEVLAAATEVLSSVRPGEN